MVERRIKSLLVPYMSFVLLLLLADVIKYMGFGLIPWYWKLKNLFGVALGGTFTVERFGPIWFLTCLFMVTISYNYAIGKLGSPATLKFVLLAVVSVAIATLITFSPFKPSPWGLLTVPAAFFFFWAGHVLAGIGIGNRRAIIFVLVVLLLSYAAYQCGSAFKLNMKDCKVDPPVLGLFLAAALSLIFMWLSRLLAPLFNERLLQILGECTLTIMMLHQYVHYSLEEFGIKGVWLTVTISFLIPLGLHFILLTTPATRMLFLGRSPTSFPSKKVSTSLSS